MSELKWVDGIITGMNTQDVSGYAVVTDDVVESYPIPHEYDWIIKQTLQQIADLQAKNRELHLDIQTYKEFFVHKDRLSDLQAENERLKDELSAIAEVHKQVMEERCPSDEKHCTCVPVLRREIEQLKTDKLIWLTEKEQMTDNFQKCKQAAEYWKGQAEQLQSDKRELVALLEDYKNEGEMIYRHYYICQKRIVPRCLCFECVQERTKSAISKHKEV